MAATSGTSVCGTLPSGETVWSAASAPYSICADGVTVPADGTLTLSGAAGGFSVVAVGDGGLSVQGTVRTLLTSSATRILFDGSRTTPGSWAGVVASAGATVTLDSVDVEHAVDGLRTEQAATVSIADSTVGDVSRDGVAIKQDAGRPSLSNLTVRRAGRYGVAIHGSRNGTITAGVRGIQVTGSGTDTTALAPAVFLDGVDGSWGAGGDIDALSGAGNGVDAIAWSGTLTGDLDWPSPTNAATAHPLGFVPIGLTVNGNLTLPAAAVVRGANDPNRAGWALRVQGSLTGLAGETTVSPLRDASSGAAFCPSALDTNPCGYDTQVTVEPPGAATVALDHSHWHSSTLVLKSTAITASVTNSSFDQVGVTTSASTALTADTFTSNSSLTSWGPSLALAASTFQNSTFQPGGSSVDVAGTTFDASPVRASHTFMDKLSFTFCTFRNAPDSALDITGDFLEWGTAPPAYRPTVTLQDSTFTHNGLYWRPLKVAPAVRLDMVDSRLGPGGTIARVTGSNNGIDAMAIGGREDGSFTWQTPTQSTDAHPLGYLLLSELRVARPALVTIPHDAVVKGGELRLEGSDLDATAGGAVFTGFWDNSAASPTCPSTLLDNCAYRNFNGIGLLRGDDPAGDMGTIRVTGASFRYSHIAHGDPTWNWGQMTGGSVVVSGTTGDHSSFSTPSGSLVLDHVAVTDGGVGGSGPMTVTNSTINTDPTTTDEFQSGLSDDYGGPTPILISDTTLSGSGIFLINRDDQHLNPGIKLQHVSVSGERSGQAVVRLHNASVTMGPGKDIDGLTGYGNGLDAITVEPEIRGDFTWTGLSNSASPHALGLITPTPIRLVGPGTMTVPRGALVKALDLDLRGERIDATAGGATFTPAVAENLDILSCTATSTGLQGNCQARLPIYDGYEPDGSQSDVDLADAHLVDTSVSVTSRDGQRHLRWLGGTADNVILSSTGGPLDLRNLTMNWSVVQASNSSGNALDHLLFTSAPAAPVQARNASGSFTASRIDGMVFAPWDPAPFVVTSDTQPWTLRCDAVTNNTAGVAVPDGSAVSASNLYRTNGDPHRFDLSSHYGEHTTADGVWWGQPGGPRPDQIDGPVVVTNSAAAPQPVGTITTSGSAMRPDGSVGTGTLTVSVASSRPMETSVPLVVTLTGSDGVAHSVSGSWVDDSHWTGSYTVTSASVSSGSNTITASSGRGCVPDPGTNLMTPTTRTVVVDAPTPPPPPSATSPIAAKYAALGGSSSFLGQPSGGEYAVGSGRGQNYARGRIYWSSATGAHEVHGLILTRYLNAGGPTGFLGFPTSDETAAGKGRSNTFSGGNVYWSSATGAHSVQGAILAEYRTMGGPTGTLGFPTTDETTTPDKVGRFNHFQVGSIYWTPSTGAHEVQGKIRDKWKSLGWERSRLGYPTRDEYAVTGGRRSDFQHGSISWNSKTGATTVTYR